MERLARDDQLQAYAYHGVWHPMDSLRDRSFLESEWTSGQPGWRIW